MFLLVSKWRLLNSCNTKVYGNQIKNKKCLTTSNVAYNKANLSVPCLLLSKRKYLQRNCSFSDCVQNLLEQNHQYNSAQNQKTTISQFFTV